MDSGDCAAIRSSDVRVCLADRRPFVMNARRWKPTLTSSRHWLDVFVRRFEREVRAVQDFERIQRNKRVRIPFSELSHESRFSVLVIAFARGFPTWEEQPGRSARVPQWADQGKGDVVRTTLSLE